MIVACGMVHGRFQPFHAGHLEYLGRAAERCERLLVGITNPDRLSLLPEADDPLRHLPESNPFTYTERLLMIDAAVREARLGARVHAIPFPINDPSVWPDYVPEGTVHFLRLFSRWGDAKLRRLTAHGYRVVVVDEGAEKQVSGSQVRALMRAGDPGWQGLVPPAVARVISALPRHSSTAGDRADT